MTSGVEMVSENLFAILCLILPVGLLTLFVLHRVVEFETGSGISASYTGVHGWRVIGLFTLGFLLLIMVISLHPAVFPIIMGLCAGILLAILIRATVRNQRIRQEDILLDLGRVESKVGLFVGALLMIPALLLAPAMFRSGRGWEDWLALLFFLAVGCFWLANSLATVYVTSRGFGRFLDDISWEKITALQWASEHNPVLTLTLTGKGQRISWYIPTRYRPELDRLLRQHLSAEQAGTARPTTPGGLASP
jgi:hypothetical protein